MKQVPLQFNADEYNFIQVKRTKDIAIYKKQCAESTKIYYEVVRIRVVTEKIFPNEVSVPEHEIYPPTSHWGFDGWTCFNWEEALVKFNKLVFKKEDTKALLKNLMESI